VTRAAQTPVNMKEKHRLDINLTTNFLQSAEMSKQ
jgi:hypothetical protein